MGASAHIALDVLSAAAFGQGLDFVIETGRHVRAPTLAELASELGAPGAAEDALLAAQRVHAASGL